MYDITRISIWAERKQSFTIPIVNHCAENNYNKIPIVNHRVENNYNKVKSNANKAIFPVEM